jgi:hypothetical protein
MTPEQRVEIIALNNRRERPVQILEARKKKFEFALEIVALPSVDSAPSAAGNISGGPPGQNPKLVPV